MVKVDIVDENDTPLKGKRAFFKDFNQNNKTEIALLEQIPDIKRRIATVFSNANRKWGEKQYAWAQTMRRQSKVNQEFTQRMADELRIRKELTQRRADESRASMIAALESFSDWFPQPIPQSPPPMAHVPSPISLRLSSELPNFRYLIQILSNNNYPMG